ncbi:Replication stress response regulator SDE2-like [Homarus americanus]|uniref:Replication stress response regulator SDE2-like n=2 Tax=Homarus americanus TaxID=6706 RepID=A0A8J5K2X8_HOMAM|nr:Replication stress response regulator SDE2-like [Homarus americanus]
MMILESHISGHRQSWCITGQKDMTGSHVLEALTEREGQVSDVVLQCAGRILSSSSPVPEGATVVATLRLPGGKGGFGSMLRAIGAQIEKTTNREACRDLSGRRLRDINEEKRLKDFISKKAEREREVLQRKRQKFEKLKETPKHIFQDDSYYQQREIREKNLFDSLDKAFQNENGSGPSGIKRQKPNIKEKDEVESKRGRFIDDLDVTSEEESESDDEAACEVKEDCTQKDEGNKHKEDEGKSSCRNTDDDHTAEDKKDIQCNEDEHYPDKSGQPDDTSEKSGSDTAEK